MQGMHVIAQDASRNHTMDNSRMGRFPMEKSSGVPASEARGDSL
jgi:hypothetical protein